MSIRTDEQVETLISKLEADEEINLAHPWVTKYRVPVVDNVYPRWYYIGALVVPPEEVNPDDNIWGSLMPTEEEAALVGKYIEFTIESFFLPWYAESMKRVPVDIEGGFNTITFNKTKIGWTYRRSTWDMGPFPHLGTDIRFETLMELLDHIEKSYLKEGGINEKWAKFKETHSL